MPDSGCKKLKSITIPASIKSIGIMAFEQCSTLKNVYYYGTETDWNNIKIQRGNDYLTKAKLFTSWTQTTVSDNGKSFTVKPINIANGNTVILALYNGDKLAEVQSAVYSGEDIAFTTSESYTKAKVFVWGNLTDIIPICDVEIVK